MRSFEVLKRAADRVGVKALAAELRLTPALIYKWCQEYDPHDPDKSGARNPLDRLSDLVRVTGDIQVVNWLCHEADGFFVKNPTEHPVNIRTELLVETQRLVQEFSQLLLTVTRSIEDDGRIEPAEADRIRDALDAGTDVVLDRYWYSGAAYTMALECGADADWCAAPERGLPRADVVFYLECDTAVALARGKGAERYERVAFQDKVAAAFETLVARAPATAQRIDASAPADAVHAAVLRALDQ